MIVYDGAVFLAHTRVSQISICCNVFIVYVLVWMLEFVVVCAFSNSYACEAMAVYVKFNW